MNKDEENFTYKEGIFGGREAILINPNHSDSGWTKDNLFNRSKIIDKISGETLSIGLPKFFNYSQSPDLYPDPNEFNDWEIRSKTDGSLVLLDFLDKQYLIRTRGSFDHFSQANSDEFKTIFDKYPRVKRMAEINSDYTFLFEIVTPNNRIVIHYPEVDFIFIGAIHKKDEILASESSLDNLADIFQLKRPKKYDFKSLEDIKSIIESWDKEEGVVLTYNDSRNKVKLKSPIYCFRHRIFSGIKSTSDVLDKLLEVNPESFEDFFSWYVANFDYEIAKELEETIQQVFAAHKLYLTQHEVAEKFVKSIRYHETRKEQAEEIMSRYGNRPLLKSLCFILLENKTPDNKMVRKLIEANL